MRPADVRNDMWFCLIIEDDASTARYLSNALTEAGHATLVCSDGQTGLRHAMTGAWHVIILDRMLPGQVDGLTILEALRKLGKKTPVLVLSALSSLDERVRGLRNGGDDYLVKPFALPELMARLEALLRWTSPDGQQDVLQVGDLVVRRSARLVERAGRMLSLKPREYHLLLYLLMHANQVVTRSMLLSAVWGFNFEPRTNAVEVQISRLRQKLDAPFSFPLLHTVRGTGYMLAEVVEAT